MPYLLAGPFVALVGIVAVFFVLRRKSVEKRSMYSARRSQIEHKVRAARQRTLAPHGRPERQAEATAVGAEPSPFAATEVQPMVTYETPAYEAPPVAPPSQPPPPPAPPAETPWDTTPVAAPGFDYPPAPPEPAYTPPASEPFQPAPEPTPMAPSEPAWTPAPHSAEPAEQLEPVTPAASSTSAGGWSVVSTSKDSAAGEPAAKQRGDKGGLASAWQLASGDTPGADAGGDGAGKPSSGTLRAVAQYAILVVGLVMVLIGVLVMVANSPSSGG